MGYWIVPPQRGRGVATAAVRLIAPWALDALDLRRLEAWADLASQGVLRSAGFEQEGRVRNVVSTGGRVSDALVFSAIPRPD